MTDILETVNKHRKTVAASLRADMNRYAAHWAEHGTDLAEWEREAR
jgi:hypothetical protein